MKKPVDQGHPTVKDVVKSTMIPNERAHPYPISNGFIHNTFFKHIIES